jgi:hypothetical protein
VKKLTPAQLEMLVRLMGFADNPQNLEALQYVTFQFDFKEYEQFIIECPPGSIRFNNVLRTAVLCDNIGFLVESDAVDRDAVYELFPIPWAKLEPVLLGMRRELDWPDAFDYFERLGHDYIKWWDAKRKRLKPLPPLPQQTGTPRSMMVARTRAPLPQRPVVPPRPAPGALARPGAAGAQPNSSRPGMAGKPTLRVLAKPTINLGGKPVKLVKANVGAKAGKSKGKRK